ncbi:MAG: imidazole glycerol phosphate synthase subunit HisH [Bacillota bacterium]
MIVILDYGLGNLYNLKNALKKIGFESKISNNSDEILNADILFMPGVGAFYEAIKNLKNKDLIDVLNKRNEKKLPIVGICLGMQLLFEESYEKKLTKGLGFLKGSLKKFDISLKIPHMGWNKLEFKNNSFINEDLDSQSYGYFVHSFYLTDYNKKDLIAYSDYEVKVPAIVKNNNLIGIQFHPEKSSKDGLKILENIIKEFI